MFSYYAIKFIQIYDFIARHHAIYIRNTLHSRYHFVPLLSFYGKHYFFQKKHTNLIKKILFMFSILSYPAKWIYLDSKLFVRACTWKNCSPENCQLNFHSHLWHRKGKLCRSICEIIFFPTRKQDFFQLVHLR